MGRAPCCDKATVKKGPWSPQEDEKLKVYLEKNGTGGNWIALPQKAGLKRCGKSCRLRWLNYLRPNIKHGDFSDVEDRIICSLFASIGSRWSIIAAQLPGRTDNDIKNYWNTKLKKKLMGLLSQTKYHQSCATFSSSSSSSSVLYNCKKINSYDTTTGSFSGLEPNSSFSNSLLLSPNSCITSVPTLGNKKKHLQVQENLLIYGGDHQASCSSSDGSSNNQMSYGKELDYQNSGRNDNREQMGLQNNCFYNGADEENNKFLNAIDNGSFCEQKPCGFWSETPILEYGLEEIKQLMSSSTSSCNSILFDENKAGGNFMYY